MLKLLADPSSTVLVGEHHDRATRVGVRALAPLLEPHGRRGEVVTLADLADTGRARRWGPIWSPASPAGAPGSTGRGAPSARPRPAGAP
jgi:hypothetical protein